MTTTPKETAVTEQVELDNCKLCGGKAELIIPHDGSKPYVMCTVNYCTQPKDTAQLAIAAWNTRPATDPAKDVEVSELADSIATLIEWRERQPDYQGEDAKAHHYRKNRLALDTAIQAMESTAAQSQLIEAADNYVAGIEAFENGEVVDAMPLKTKLYEAVKAWREGK